MTRRSYPPRSGERLLVAELDRAALVVGVQAQVEPNGLTACVYVRDPMGR